MIRRAKEVDCTSVAKLALLLWPDHTLEEFEDSFRQLIQSESAVVFLAYKEDRAIGFAQCQLRNDYVEGTSTSPVGYLEGLFVQEEFRNAGYGRLLVAHCEQWAKEKGCIEFASDCEFDNKESYAVHLKLGFSEANRIICFTKSLT